MRSKPLLLAILFLVEMASICYSVTLSLNISIPEMSLWMKDYSEAKNESDYEKYDVTDRWWSCLMKEYYRRKTCLMFSFHKLTILAPYNPVTSGRENIQFVLRKARLQTVVHYKNVYGSWPQFSAYLYQLLHWRARQRKQSVGYYSILHKM